MHYPVKVGYADSNSVGTAWKRKEWLTLTRTALDARPGVWIICHVPACSNAMTIDAKAGKMLSCTQSYPWWDLPAGMVAGFAVIILVVRCFGLKGFFAFTGISGVGFILILIYLSRHGC